MPTSEEKKRGGVKRYRTIKLPNGKYMTCGIVHKKGKRGGVTVCSKPKEKKMRG